ncbi:hypothetical protein EON65_27285 [archaeon]|nr:MAG: hypothetical protein EON65_27285 [archaeon]
MSKSSSSAGHNSQSKASAEMEQLREANARLSATVQELKLEISYYKGESKRLELEKNVLSQDVTRMSGLFKNWLNELQVSTARNVFKDGHYISNVVQNPCRSICDVLQLSDQTMFLTSCQPPYHIEVCVYVYVCAIPIHIAMHTHPMLIICF